MIDREYIKLNTSIQTASNRSDLVPDENGNYPAVIELNLPNNIFKAKDGAKKVDKVSMLTTKMRMSMSETPIAQIPVDDTVDIPGVLASKCQFDVYPFALLNNEQLQPRSIDRTVFPKYKKHIITYTINAYLEDLTNFVELESISVIANNNETFPVTSRFYQILEENNALVNNADHLMNLCISSTRGVTREQNSSSVLLNNIGTIEQMLEDGLENAITYASAQTETIVTISLVNAGLDFSSLTENLPNLDSTLYLEDYGVTVCFWKSERESGSENNTSLVSACKPKFSFDAQTMSLSYDSAPFSENVPVVWNQAYVNTFERPEQLEIDTLREDMWITPPPKRMYQYDVSTSSEPDSYNFALDGETNCGVMNLIGNKMMKETFSFLPWIKVDLSKISQLSGLPNYQYGVEFTKEVTRKKLGEGVTSASWIVEKRDPSSPTYIRIYNIPNTESYTEDVVWLVYQYDMVGESPSNATSYLCYPQDRNSFDGNVTLVGNVGWESEEFTDSIFDFDYSTYTSYDEPIIISSDTSVYEQYSTNVNMQGTLGSEVISTQVKDDSSRTEVKTYLSPVTIHYNNFTLSNYGVICWSASHNGKPIPLYQRIPDSNITQTLNGLFSLGGALPNIECDFTLQTQIDGGTRYYEVWELVASLRPLDNFAHPYRAIFGRAPMDTSVVSSYIQENEIIERDVTTILSKTTTLLSSIPKYEFIPNLDLENETTFYMLDCISSKVNIGEQEVVELPQDAEEEELFRVTETTSTWEETTSNELKWQGNPYAPDYGSSGVFNFYTQGFVNSGWSETFDSSLNKNNLTMLAYVFWRQTTPTLGTYNYVVLIADDAYNEYNGTHSELRGVNSYNFKEQNLEILNTSTTVGEPTISTNTFITSENIIPGTQTTVLDQDVESGPISPTSDYNFDYQYVFNLWRYDRHRDSGVDPMVSLPGLELKEGPFRRFEYKQDFPFLNEREYADLAGFHPLRWDLSSIFSGVSVDGSGLGGPLHYIPAVMEVNQQGDPVPESPIFEYVVGRNNVASLHYETRHVTESITVDVARYFVALRTGPRPTLPPHPQDPQPIWPHSFTITATHGPFTRTDTTIVRKQSVTTEVTPIMPEPSLTDYKGNVRLNFTWDNLPTVTLSPITSFVLTLAGARVTDEIQPVNVADNALASAQLSTIPIIENYYSTASTLRDLHDELIVIRDQVTNAATYTLANTGGEERTLKFAVKYITKDGKLHQVYIPPNGVFTLQLTFILDLVSI